MRRRVLLTALLAATAAAPALPAEPRPDDGAWARFDDLDSASAARAIVASDVPGDAAISSLAVDGGLLVVTGSLSDAHGSRWTTLGTEIAPASGPGAVDLRGSTALRIRLASAVPRMLRVRLKGGDPQLGNTGCYPVVMQQATPTLTDYTIPLSAFSTPSWCGPNAPTVDQTLPAVERVEVTANDTPAGAVDLRIGHIDFLAEAPAAAPAEPDGRWRLAWGDDFDGAPGAPASPARWQPDGDVAQDGLGHLALRPRPHADGWAARTALRATPANTLLYGRVDVRLRVPADAGGVPSTVRLALQGATADAGAIVLLEGDAHGAFATGLDAPGAPSRTTRLRAPLATPLDAGFHTITTEWEPDRIRWFVDGALAQERRRDELPANTWSGIDQRPLALDVSIVANGDRHAGAADDARAALVLDEVRVWQRDDLVAAAAQVLGTAHGGAPAPQVAVAAAPRRRPVTTAANNSAAAPAPAKHVVCEHSARYELMLCY